MKASSDHDISYIERRDSLDAIGFAGKEYQSYVDSKIWFDIRANLSKHEYFHECAVCKALGKRTPTKHLHHKHYRQMTPIDAFPDYIIPLCQYHHKQIHDMAAHSLDSIEDATDLLLKTVGAPLCCPDEGRDIYDYEMASIIENL